MVSVQSSIRAEVSRGDFPAPSGAGAFSAYAIASAKGLIPEMEYAARLTLNHPMTFEILAEVISENSKVRHCATLPISQQALPRQTQDMLLELLLGAYCQSSSSYLDFLVVGIVHVMGFFAFSLVQKASITRRHLG